MTEPDDEEALRAKLDALRGALEKRAAESRAGGPAPSEGAANASAMAMGLRAGSEFVAAIVIGGFLGWRLDLWLGTKPAFLIAFFLLGTAAGVVGVIRETKPKAHQNLRDSRLSGDAAPDKDVPRSAPTAGGAAPEGADDDED